MNEPKTLTKDELKNYVNFLTVKDLKDFIERHNIPDDALVMFERIEDVYFKNHNWGVYLKDNETSVLQTKIDPSTSEKDLNELKSQYVPLFSCCLYKDDRDFLFLTSHY